MLDIQLNFRYESLAKITKEDKLLPFLEQAIKDIFSKYLEKLYLENLILLKKKKNQLTALESKINSMYIDKLSGIIKEDDFNNVYKIFSNQKDT